jgi:hypothetical protein
MRPPTPGFSRLHFLIALVSLFLASLIFSGPARAPPRTRTSSISRVRWCTGGIDDNPSTDPADIPAATN